MQYTYKAITENGSNVSGTIEAVSEAQAMERISAKGYIPQVIRPDSAMGKDLLSILDIQLGGSVKPQELLLLTRQIKTMLDAGLSVSRTLEVLEGQLASSILKEAIIQIAEDIRQGSSLYKAFSRHPKVFSELYINMIEAGENSGRLPDVLDRLSYLIDHDMKVRAKIKSALTYPVIVVITLTGAFFFLLTFVMPRFVTLFTRSGIELPWPTQVCITLSDFIFSWWHMIIVLTFATLFALIAYTKTPAGAVHRDQLLLKIPLVGPVLQKAAMSRFASIFSLLQSSGVTVLSSMGILSRTIGNAAIAREFDSLEEKLREGRGISAPLRGSPYFPPMVVDMIAVGEESGNLDDMLQQVSAHYDYEVEFSVAKMSEMIGPLMTLGLAAVVGFFALAIMMPIFSLTKVISGG